MIYDSMYNNANYEDILAKINSKEFSDFFEHELHYKAINMEKKRIWIVRVYYFLLFFSVLSVIIAIYTYTSAITTFNIFFIGFIISIFILFEARSFFCFLYEYNVKKEEILPIILKFIGDLSVDNSKETHSEIKKEINKNRLFNNFNHFDIDCIIRGKYKFYNIYFTELGLCKEIKDKPPFVRIGDKLRFHISRGILIKVQIDNELKQRYISAVNVENKDAVSNVKKIIIEQQYTMHRVNDCFYIPVFIPIIKERLFSLILNNRADDIENYRKIALKIASLFEIIDNKMNTNC